MASGRAPLGGDGHRAPGVPGGRDRGDHGVDPLSGSRRDRDGFVRATDDHQRYVAVSGGVHAALGYQPTELLGRRISDIAAPDLVEATPAHWSRFIADGRQDGEYRLLTRDGGEEALRFQARAHHPILSSVRPRAGQDLYPFVNQRLTVTNCRFRSCPRFLCSPNLYLIN